jgi:exopolyphosphatase/guanosine-5'-triphosphate,3'-diphosphate pyrophosphatase
MAQGTVDRRGRSERGRKYHLRSRRPPQDGRVYAAVDLGTNNCRLLIASPTRRGFRVVGSFSRIVRLGEGLSERGNLSEVAMSRTIEALKVCAERMKHHGVIRSRNVATAACRTARNCGLFIERIGDQTGLAFETITPGEEARLAVAGCRSLFSRDYSRALVFDIGGGSTEVIWVDKSKNDGCVIEDMISLPFGVVTLSESRGGDISPTDYRDLVEDVKAELEPFSARNGIARHFTANRVQTLGTSGTVTTLGAVFLGLKRYSRTRVDGLDITFDTLVQVGRKLTGMPFDDRVAMPCIGGERAELVVPGAAILEAIGAIWPISVIRIADRGLREGMLLDLMAADRSPSPVAGHAAPARE